MMKARLRITFHSSSREYICKKIDIMQHSFASFLEDFKQEIINEVIRVIKQESTTPMTKEFYSLKEVSSITGLSINSIKGRYRRGSIARVYSGNKPLIPACELDKLLNALKIQSKKH